MTETGTVTCVTLTCQAPLCDTWLMPGPDTHLTLIFYLFWQKCSHIGWPQRLLMRTLYFHVHKPYDKEEYQCTSSVWNMSFFAETLMLVIMRLKLFLENCLVRDKSVIINDPNIPSCALSWDELEMREAQCPQNTLSIPGPALIRPLIMVPIFQTGLGHHPIYSSFKLRGESNCLPELIAVNTTLILKLFVLDWMEILSFSESEKQYFPMIRNFHYWRISSDLRDLDKIYHETKDYGSLMFVSEW